MNLLLLLSLKVNSKELELEFIVFTQKSPQGVLVSGEAVLYFTFIPNAHHWSKSNCSEGIFYPHACFFVRLFPFVNADFQRLMLIRYLNYNLLLWFKMNQKLKFNLPSPDGLPVSAMEGVEITPHFRVLFLRKWWHKEKLYFLTQVNHGSSLHTWLLKSNLLQTGCHDSVHAEFHSCQYTDALGTCVKSQWAISEKYAYTYIYILFYYLFCVWNHRSRVQLSFVRCAQSEVDSWAFLNQHATPTSKQIRILARTHMHTHTPAHWKMQAFHNCVTSLRAQVHCGTPVYFLQLIDHMNSVELDWESVAQRVM